jgi:hypothetical protein
LLCKTKPFLQTGRTSDETSKAQTITGARLAPSNLLNPSLADGQFRNHYQHTTDLLGITNSRSLSSGAATTIFFLKKAHNFITKQFGLNLPKQQPWRTQTPDTPNT